MDIEITYTDHPGVMPPIADVGFGRYFTDHMFLMNYSEENGWHSPRIEPYHALGLEPANLTLHYGQTIFEGMKAYRWPDDSVHLFRVEDHARRFARSANRLCIPEFDTDVVIEGVRTLVDVDRAWVPEQRGMALYVRPTLIATDCILGVRPSKTYLMFIITSPVGSYYARGAVATRIWVEEHYSRVAAGGLGEAKTAANYAASMMAAEQARARGFDQVLWLDAAEHKYVEEVGTMNIFFVIDGVLITPPLDGTILNGVTRRSVIALAKEWGVPVEERMITMAEVASAHEAGMLQEAFGSGTAVVISPIGTLHYRGRDMGIEDRPESLRSRLYNAITGIQYGKTPDTNGWVSVVPTRHAAKSYINAPAFSGVDTGDVSL